MSKLTLFSKVTKSCTGVEGEAWADFVAFACTKFCVAIVVGFDIPEVSKGEINAVERLSKGEVNFLCVIDFRRDGNETGRSVVVDILDVTDRCSEEAKVFGNFSLEVKF